VAPWTGPASKRVIGYMCLIVEVIRLHEQYMHAVKRHKPTALGWPTPGIHFSEAYNLLTFYSVDYSSHVWVGARGKVLKTRS
jgi:hypothetical protein